MYPTFKFKYKLKKLNVNKHPTWHNGINYVQQFTHLQIKSNTVQNYNRKIATLKDCDSF